MGFDKDTLERILALQEVDRVIFSLKERLSKLPNLIEEKKKEIAEMEKRIKSEEEEIRAMEKEIKGLYLDLEDTEEAIKKYMRDLMNVKTNEEYRAVQSEIEYSKRKKLELEEDILLKEEKLEEKKKRFQSFKSETLREIEEERGKLKKMEEERLEIPKRLEEAIDLRKRRAMVIDKIALEEYERILDGRGYPAVCEVELKVEGNERKFFCTGCSSQIPFYTVDEIIKTDSTSYCHYCGRIIFIKKGTI
ncbi:MAG: hypothetical protein ABDH49_04930 [Candidatus Hydrothermales bacterium]